jgi:hypothetical protein
MPSHAEYGECVPHKVKWVRALAEGTCYLRELFVLLIGQACH